MKWLKRLLALIQETLWPRRTLCLCCMRPSRGEHLCRRCQEHLETLRIREPARDSWGLAVMRSVWQYKDESRTLIHALKYQGVADAAQVLAEGMAELAGTLSLPPETIVTWPTMPARRTLERGIDHGRLLAGAVGERLNLPVKQLLIRSNKLAAKPQAGMTRAQRLQRLKGAFSCEDELSGPVLLVDDVLTTGSTATVCAECLLRAGASAVIVVTAARADGSGKKRRGGRGK